MCSARRSPALAIVLSLVSERGWLGIGPGTAMLGSIVVSLLALACLGRRVPFMVALAALMLSYGGWSTLARSASDGRTRSYFGIYEVYDRARRQPRGCSPTARRCTASRI